MSRYIYAIMVTLLLSGLLAAAEGMVYHGDLNGDGVADSIEQGPLDWFGTVGGPWLLTLSGGESGERHRILWASNGMFSLDEIEPGQHYRLWYYYRMTPQAGYLEATSLSTLEVVGGAEVFTRRTGRSVSHDLVSAVMSEPCILKFESKADYEAPELPEGMTWEPK